MPVNNEQETWFNLLFAEFQNKHAAMFAFSKKQVVDHFEEWGEPAPVFPLQGWVPVGAGLLVRDDVATDFLRRMESDWEAHQSSLPAVTLEQLGVDPWDRPQYRVLNAGEGAPVHVGEIVVDASLRAPGEATEVHSITDQGEPIATLPVRVIHAAVAT